MGDELSPLLLFFILLRRKTEINQGCDPRKPRTLRHYLHATYLLLFQMFGPETGNAASVYQLLVFQTRDIKLIHEEFCILNTLAGVFFVWVHLGGSVRSFLSGHSFKSFGLADSFHE